MNLALLGEAVGEGSTVMFHGKDGHWSTMEGTGGNVAGAASAEAGR